MNYLIAKPGEDEYSHHFGGSQWDVVDPSPIVKGPHLLLELNLADPKLENLPGTQLKELPLFSYINCDVWINPQVYRLYAEKRLAVLESRGAFYTTVFEGGLEYATPLPSKPVVLEEATLGSVGSDQEVDRFLGGTEFIRILGEPTWLLGYSPVTCPCDRPCTYVASIGSDLGNPTGLIDGGTFFIGEACLSFFLCFHCCRLTVISEPT